jgi:hypothetical protein
MLDGTCQRIADTNARGLRLLTQRVAPQVEHRYLYAFRSQRRTEYSTGLTEADECNARKIVHGRASCADTSRELVATHPTFARYALCLRAAIGLPARRKKPVRCVLTTSIALSAISTSPMFAM